MKLVYRGNIYHIASTDVEIIHTEMTGKHRGTVVTLRSLQSFSIPNAVIVMTYRGVKHLSMR